MREGDVCHDAAPEERADASFRPVVELIGNDDIERLVLVLQAANRAGRQNPFDAEDLEAEDVRPEVELRRQDLVAGAVAGQKGDALTFQCAEEIRSRGIAEWR